MFLRDTCSINLFQITVVGLRCELLSLMSVTLLQHQGNNMKIDESATYVPATNTYQERIFKSDGPTCVRLSIPFHVSPLDLIQSAIIYLQV
jgi:hypothetical protein